jgi:ABC-type nitrate/sulfonate/bicarbonate transport system permease component
MSAPALASRGLWPGLVLAPAARIRLWTALAALIGWELLAWSGLLYRDVVPPLEQVLLALAALVADPDLYPNMLATGYEVLVGFAIAAIAGIAGGLGLGASRLLHRAAEPYMDALASAPKIVFLPIAMLFFGLGMESKIALGALSGLFPILLNTMAGVRALPAIYGRVGRSLHLSAPQAALKIYIPALRRPIVTGLRLGLGVCVVGILLAEIKLSKIGLGHLAADAYSHFRVAELYAVLILIFVLASLANLSLTLLLRRKRGRPGALL